MKTLTLVEKMLTAIQKPQRFMLAIIAEETIDGEQQQQKQTKKIR